MGDVIHDPLDPDHALGAAKAAKGGGALGIGAQAMRFNAHIGQEIGIVGVQHGPIRHGQRQILRPAAAGVLHKGDALDHASGVHTHAVIYAEIMPFAGDDHVIVPVIAHLGWSSGRRGHDGAGDGQRVALAFLAAKAAAHATGFDPHIVHGLAQGIGHLVLNLSRVLGR